MKRLTTDRPDSNLETALNLFYVKDEWVWVRGGGPAPKYEDISLCDYVRMIAQGHKLDMELSSDDYKVSDAMAELLFDGTDTIEGIVATLYTAGWAFAELRERLKAYEDTGLTVEQAKEFAPKALNPPLTLEKLLEMDGEPVYCVSNYERTVNGEKGHWFHSEEWGIVAGTDMGDQGFIVGTAYIYYLEDYGKTWLAYRRKPEGADL